ncbi:MAG: four helix bundle protein [Gemmatimonadales bacterium]|nr:four helix bundle protein [Gemmatimonadales bacterium]
MQPYERFEAWQRSHALTLAVFNATDAWPRTERYGLTAQVRRCAFSVTVNLVEGSAKRGRAEFRRFLDIALGSMAELAYTLRLARDLGLMDHDAWRALEAERVIAARMLWGLYRSLRGPSQRANTPSDLPPVRSSA